MTDAISLALKLLRRSAVTVFIIVGSNVRFTGRMYLLMVSSSRPASVKTLRVSLITLKFFITNVSITNPDIASPLTATLRVAADGGHVAAAPFSSRVMEPPGRKGISGET